MDVMTAIRTRRSIRSWADRPVEEDKLRLVLEAGRLAPSASNGQQWRFVVVRDPGTRRKLAVAANNQGFVGDAPVVVAACSTSPVRVMACGVPAHAVDLAIAVDHMTLKAAEEGLGTCWIGAFQQDEVREILGIPQHVKVVTLFPLGYPAEQPQPTRRKAFEDVVAFEKW